MKVQAGASLKVEERVEMPGRFAGVVFKEGAELWHLSIWRLGLGG